jgi:hypothetical protein
LRHLLIQIHPTTTSCPPHLTANRSRSVDTCPPRLLSIYLVLLARVPSGLICRGEIAKEPWSGSYAAQVCKLGLHRDQTVIRLVTKASDGSHKNILIGHIKDATYNKSIIARLSQLRQLEQHECMLSVLRIRRQTTRYASETSRGVIWIYISSIAAAVVKMLM